ncbi:MAG: hypothetical protein V4465_00710 [Patescibacteria group bacterium]
MKRYWYSAAILFLIVFFGSWAARSTGLYNSLWYTDLILHSLSGAGFGLVWVALDNGREKRKWFLILGAIGFAALGSVMWEFWEFEGWRITPSHMRFYIPELGDTLGDVASGLFGGLLSGLLMSMGKVHNSDL